MLKAKPTGFIESKNWIFKKAIEQTYAQPLIHTLKKNRVFCASSYRGGATAYYRTFLPFKVLRDGYKLVDAVCGFELPDDKQLWADHINTSNVLVLEREFTPDLIPAINRYKKSNGPVLYDIDDHILGFRNIGTYHTVEEKYINEFWADKASDDLLSVINNSDLIVATTPKLGEEYTRLTGVKNVTVRNAIDSMGVRWNFPLEKFGEDREELIIGFMGGATHGADLDLIFPIVNDILSENPHVVFKFIGYAPTFLFDLIEKWGRKRIRTSFGWSSLEKYPSKMYDIDIGLAPLANNEFNRIGKSDLKYLEYTMAGVITVASAVGQYKDTISHKKNGYLVKDEDGWYSTLSAIAKRPEQIKAVLENAVEDVLVNRSALEIAKEWYKVIMAARNKWESKLAK